MIHPDDIQKIIGPEGIFAKKTPGYETRRQQIDMSLSVADAFNHGRLLLAEAGTGVGKTLAYLSPAYYLARDGRVIIISTNTINLQNQLIRKDIPALFDPEEISYALVKGRNNYVCRSEVDYAAGSILHDGEKLFKRFLKWVGKTETGDYEDIDFEFPYWAEVRSDMHTCRKNECPYFQSGRCFYYNMRKKAEGARLIVTNHALFFSDLALKAQDRGPGGDKAGDILPEYSCVVFDEAHHLEEVASNVFSAELSNLSLPYILKRLRNRKEFDLSDALLDSVGKLSDMMFGQIRTDKPDFFIEDVSSPELLSAARDLSEQLGVVIDELEDIEDKDIRAQAESFCDMLSEVRMSIGDILFGQSEEMFRWGEVRGETRNIVSLHSTPVSVSDGLRDNLFARGDTSIVLTSATLASGEGFDYIKSRLGIDLIEDEDRVREYVYDSPFDYREQMLLYVPRDTPPPSDSMEYAALLADKTEQLLSVTRGGAFLLFTSYSMMNKVYDILARKGSYDYIRQGDMPGAQLIKEFTEDPNTVLMGTSGFWEGVDIPGDRLRLVVLDKIPFPVPSSPSVKARCDYIKDLGKDPFDDYSLPEAAIRLKQGMGRLIRTRSDKGVVAILDSRLHTKRYRYNLYKAFPGCKGVTTIDKVKDWVDARMDIDRILKETAPQDAPGDSDDK
ncbi:MAG: ATP-dependent DNA helicase [Abditibacteriota bacterium]|nr:ATP-dependent DNA helicase [Abditibacteriota bacterium]